MTALQTLCGAKGLRSALEGVSRRPCRYCARNGHSVEPICAPNSLESGEPDPTLPSNATPFRALFGRHAHTPVDKMTFSLDGSEVRGGLDSFVADKDQAFVGAKAVLEKRRTDKDEARNASDVHVDRGSPGRHANVRDLVMVKDADSSLARQGTHLKLSQEPWTAPGKVESIPRSGSSLVVNLSGRTLMRRAVSVANVNPAI